MKDFIWRVNFGMDYFFWFYVIIEREKKIKKSCNTSCKNREVDKKDP